MITDSRYEGLVDKRKLTPMERFQHTKITFDNLEKLLIRLGKDIGKSPQQLMSEDIRGFLISRGISALHATPPYQEFFEESFDVAHIAVSYCWSVEPLWTLLEKLRTRVLENPLAAGYTGHQHPWKYKHVWIDVFFVNQLAPVQDLVATDGIYGSAQLHVFASPEVFDRAWCVYELSARFKDSTKNTMILFDLPRKLQDKLYFTDFVSVMKATVDSDRQMIMDRIDQLYPDRETFRSRVGHSVLDSIGRYRPNWQNEKVD